jgi:Putative DNA-binding domain
VPPLIFSATWEVLDTPAIDEFLAGEVDEGLLWEAKSDGRDPLGPHVIRKAVCGFANSERGGYLIVGVEKREGRWQLTGLTNPPAELTTWLQNVISTGVRPVPTHAIRAFEGSNGPAAIVSVEPVTVPPALTSSGGLYERVSGATNPVTDPTEVARLIAQGRGARTRAEMEALEAANHAFSAPPGEQMSCRYVVALAPASTRGARPMMTAEAYQEARRALAVVDAFDRPGSELTQRYFRVVSADAEYSILCRASYGVAFSYAARTPEDGIRILEAGESAPLREAWEAAGTVLASTGAIGAASIAVIAVGRSVSATTVRPLDTLDVDLDVVASINRELGRSQGRPRWEPQ